VETNPICETLCSFRITDDGESPENSVTPRVTNYRHESSELNLCLTKYKTKEMWEERREKKEKESRIRSEEVA
jgi:hypothetical protein